MNGNQNTSENIRLETTFKNQFYFLSHLIFSILGMSVLILLFYINGFGNLWLFYAMIFIQLLPVVLLHFRYYQVNRDSVYLIKYESIDIFEHTTLVQSIPYKKIEHITIFKSANLDGWRYQMLSFESYYYAKIKVNGNKSLYLTCLLHKDLETALKERFTGVFKRKKGLFFWI